MSSKLEPTMVTWYCSADTLFWQVSIDHNMDVQYQRGMLETEGACLCQPISWSMAAILRDSVVVVLVHTRPGAILLAKVTMRKWTHGFPFLSYMGMVLRLAALWAAGAPLKNKQTNRDFETLNLAKNRDSETPCNKRDCEAHITAKKNETARAVKFD